MLNRNGRRRVLIIEDDDLVRRLLLDVCEEEGYDAVDTVRGQDGIALAHLQPPDLVLVDWGLPDTSGIDVIRQLRSGGLTVPIVMLTGRVDEADVETGLRAGADDYLTKPVMPRALAARLTAHLRRATRDTGAADSEELKAKAATLAQVSIFFLSPPAAVRKLAGAATNREVDEGETLLIDGAANDSLYVIKSGHFRVSAETSSGRAMPVALLGPADFFGATSLLTWRSSPASVAALEDGELLVINRDDILQALPAGSPGREELSKVIAQRQALLEGAATRLNHAKTDRADVISLYSPKGGVGRTTIALNLAASIARENAGDVVLFDMSLPYNHAALLAGLAPSSSLARVSEAQERFDELLKSALVYHVAGFFVLSAALTPEEADLVNPALLERAISVLRRQFSYIVVDLSTTLSDPVLAVLERSDQVVLVAVPEFSIMKDLIQIKRVLLEVLQLPLGRLHLVANHRNATSRIGRREIESIVGLDVDHEIRFDGSRPEEAALQGNILAVSDPSSQLTKGVAGLARALSDRR